MTKENVLVKKCSLELVSQYYIMMHLLYMLLYVLIINIGCGVNASLSIILYFSLRPYRVSFKTNTMYA